MGISTRLTVPVYLSLFVLLVVLPWLFWGFHYSDIGWNASKAWLIVEHPAAAFWEFSWLSSMLGGLWMQLTEFSLFWLRTGFVLCAVLTVLLLYAILRSYYSPKAAGLSIVPCFLLYISGFEQFIPNYYTVPPLFALASMFFHLRSLNGKEPGKQAVQSLLCGIFFALTVQARIPALVLGAVFVLTAFVDWYYTRRITVSIVRFGWILAGVVFGTGLVALFLLLTGNLEHALNGLWQTYTDVSSYSGQDNIHHPLRLFTDTLVRYGKAWGVGAVLMAGAYLWAKLFPTNKPQPLQPLTVLLLILTGVLTFLFIIRGWGTFPVPMGIISVLFMGVLWYGRNGLNRERVLLYTVAVAYMVCMNLGSSNPGTGSLKYTAILLIPITLIESSRVLSGRISFSWLRLIFYANAVVLFLTTRTINHEHVFAMNRSFQAPALVHICSTEEDVNELEQLLSLLHNAGLREGDTTLCYVDIPLLHFVTRTIPALRNPWISDRSVGLPSYEKTRQQLCVDQLNDRLPSFVIRGRTIHHSTEYDTPKLRFLDDVWGREGYDTIWHTERFTVLKKPVRSGAGYP